MKKLFLFYYILTLVGYGYAAPQRYRFSYLTNNDGLPSNTVWTIAQDHKGYYWFGTRNGLCRYDGRTVGVYTMTARDPNSIPGNNVRRIFRDSSDNLWISTAGGFARYNRDTDNFTTILPDASVNGFAEDENGRIYFGVRSSLCYWDPDANQGKGEVVTTDYTGDANTPLLDFARDAEGGFWLGYNQGGLSRIIPATGERRTFRHEPTDPLSLPSDYVTRVFIDSSGRLWVGTGSAGLCRYDPERDRFYRIGGLSNPFVLDINEDSEGKLWIGTEGGLNIYDPESDSMELWEHKAGDGSGLSDNSVYCTLWDDEGNLLVGTYFGGVNILMRSSLQFTLYKAGLENGSIKGSAIRQITGGDGNDLWIGVENGGLNYYLSATGRFTHWDESPDGRGLSSNRVLSLIRDRDGIIWIGTNFGGLNRFDPATGRFSYITTDTHSGLPSNDILSLAQDRSGTIWVGTRWGISTLDPRTMELSPFYPDVFTRVPIRALREDSNGLLWIATEYKGAYSYNPAERTLVNYTPSTTPAVSGHFINYIFEDTGKRIWIATHYGGVNMLDPATGQSKLFRVADGLPSNTVYSMEEDGSGRIWITTNKGLSIYDPLEEKFVNFSYRDGLPNNQFNYNSAYRDPGGRLWFGTIDGLLGVDPQHLEVSNHIPPVEISDLRIMGESVKPGREGSPLQKVMSETSHITLTADQARSVSFEFVAPSLMNYGNIHYAIRIGNTENEWIDLGTQNQVSYANLRRGTHRFRVRAGINNVWNERPAVVTVTVLPPFWLSGWALLCYSLLLAGGAYITVRYFEARRRQRELMLAERMEKEKLREVNRIKLNFFTNVTHELRTPLTLIVSPLRTLISQKGLPEDVRGKIEMMHTNARRMQNLVDELMLTGKIETEEEKIVVKEGFALRFILEIAQGFRLLAESRNISYRTDITAGVSPVWFDPPKLEKIVFNLLSNAFKYTDPDGEILIRAGYTENAPNKTLRITISDTGRGISREELPRIFDRYYQSRSADRRDGFGIGLSTVRRLVELHKGEIRVESEPGKGSVFTVDISVDKSSFTQDEISDRKIDEDTIEKYDYLQPNPAHYNADSSARPSHSNEDASKPWVLIAEDNPELLDFIASILSPHYNTVLCSDGVAAYRSAVEKQPDLILSDWMMPGLDGLQLCRKIRDSVETCHIPFVMITARTGEDNKMEGYGKGADAYIEKPFDPALLLKRLENLITMQSNLRKRLGSKAAPDIMQDPGICERDRKLLADINSFIVANITDDNLSVSHITESVGISRTLLHTKLKKITGLSTTEYITKIRLEEAVKFLSRGMNISETAYMVGFASPNYFSRRFKQAYGKSPKDYLRQNNGKE